MNRTHKLVVAATLTALATLAVTATAYAHVTIEPATAQRGSFATVLFRVPNERSDAATTKIRVQLPPEHPMSSVLVRPVPGWTVTLEKSTPAEGQEGNIVETTSVITWEGGRIEPGFYESFEVSLGPMPDTGDVLYFPTIQYYEDGTEVPWIERPSATGAEIESPAPQIELVSDASGSRDAHGQAVDDVSSAGASSTETAAASGGDESSDATAIASISLGVAVVALIATLVSVFIVVRMRRQAD
jgi:uncharacterized protein YcnI